MKQIFMMSPKEIRRHIALYTNSGVFSRAAQFYERLLFLGKLRRYGYLRLALVYAKQGKENAAERIYNRYIAIYKY